MKPSPPLDIEAIRIRLASANPFGVPRWVASDVGHLLAEVAKLRGQVRDHEARADFVKAGGEHHRRGAEEARERLEAERAAFEKERADLVAERDALRARVEEQRAWSAETGAFVVEVTRERNQLEVRLNRARADVVSWLRAFATAPTSRVISPVRQIERTFASRAADAIERGDHVPPVEEEPPCPASTP